MVRRWKKNLQVHVDLHVNVHALFGTYCDCRDVFKCHVMHRCVHSTPLCDSVSATIDLEMTVKISVKESWLVSLYKLDD